IYTLSLHDALPILDACQNIPNCNSPALRLVQEFRNTAKFLKYKGLIDKVLKQRYNTGLSCSLPPLLRKCTRTRPPRWLITGTWKTEIQHSHTRMHSIYTRMHSIYTHSLVEGRDKTSRADEPKRVRHTLPLTKPETIYKVSQYLYTDNQTINFNSFTLGSPRWQALGSLTF